MAVEVMVALIGAAGVVLGAVAANWRAFWPGAGVVRENYSGYEPSGDLAVELRYFLEVSGVRATCEESFNELNEQGRLEQLLADPDAADEIHKIFDGLKARFPAFYDEVVREMLPVYQKHMTVDELQALNRFYSTKVMQGMVRKMPLITHDMAPVQADLFKKWVLETEEAADEAFT